MFWKDVVGFEGLYEVSDYGKIRTIEHKVFAKWGKCKTNYSRIYKAKNKKTYINYQRGGYNYVNLRKHKKQHMRRVACLVAEAFLGPRKEGYQVCHINGIPHEDYVTNLKYGTPKENQLDKIKHGTMLRGENAPNARLTKEQAIRAKYGKEPSRVLAMEFGVHHGHIKNIRMGLRWKHI